jgi:hypothetical protein
MIGRSAADERSRFAALSYGHRDADPHVHFRALLSQRLDERLPSEESKELRRHLLGCARCRAADRDFRQQRVLLRGGQPALPPRDLWARTSAALDREVARGGRNGVSPEPRELRKGSPRIAAASVIGLMLIVAVLGNQLSSGGIGTAEPTNGVARPTPFEVPTQELAFVGGDPGGFAIYRTEVSQVCPAQAIDCMTLVSRNRQVVRLRGEQELKPNSVAFHPQRDKVAIAAKSGRGESVYVVFLKPVDLDSNDTSRPPATVPLPGATTTTGTTTATATVASLTPAVSTPGLATATPRTMPSGPGGHQSGKPAHSPPPTTEPPSPDRTPRGAGGGSTTAPAASPTTPPTVIPATPSLVTSPELPVDVQPILQDVLPAGAEPAWSPNGDILAFSARPADGSRGPDIYIWRNGEQNAEQLTRDHHSYFASWAGSRIVASRAARPIARDDKTADPGLRITNVVIDPTTGEQRRVRALGLWLPLVDPTEHFAIVWLGELRKVGPAVDTVRGALYLTDWRPLDPFRVASGVPLRPRSLDDPTAPATRATDAPPVVTASPNPTVDPSASAAAGAKSRRRSPTASPSGAPDPTPSATLAATPTAPPSPTLVPTPEPSIDAQPVEPNRDIDREPVLDWVGRWNSEGDAYGFWVAETPGASWGRLTITSIDPATGRIIRDVALLGPTLAKRMFSLGQDRVAWVAPVDDQPDGELRVRTWGPNGSGTVRIRDVDAGEGVPGF